MVKQKTILQNAEKISDEFIDLKNKVSLLGKKWATLKISNLNFKYPDEKGKTLHLDNVSLLIKRKDCLNWWGWKW